MFEKRGREVNLGQVLTRNEGRGCDSGFGTPRTKPSRKLEETGGVTGREGGNKHPVDDSSPTGKTSQNRKNKT